MKPSLERALAVAAACAREAEAAYKKWARIAESEADRHRLAELGAAERGHWELLAHITPADLPAAALPLPDLGIRDGKAVRPLPSVLSAEGLSAAVAREAICADIYGRLAEMGGETAMLFQSFANEERGHGKWLQGVLDRGAGEV